METTLLVPGIKGKIDSRGELTDGKTQKVFEGLVDFFEKFLDG